MADAKPHEVACRSTGAVRPSIPGESAASRSALAGGTRSVRNSSPAIGATKAAHPSRAVAARTRTGYLENVQLALTKLTPPGGPLKGWSFHIVS